MVDFVRVIIESPYAGTSHWALVRWLQCRRNIRYARACVRDSLGRGEAPIASHLLYTQPGILKDHVQEERRWGIAAGLAWREVAQKTVVYEDYGVTQGMRFGMAAAREAGVEVEFRKIKCN